MRRIVSLVLLASSLASSLAISCGETDSDSKGTSGGSGGMTSGGGTGGGTGGAGGAGGSTGGSAGESEDAAPDGSSFSDCFNRQGMFSNYDLKICNPVLNECIFAAHQTDCCGSITYVGLQKDQKAKFDECEAAWRQTFPPCGCAPGPSTVEQAGTVSGESEVAVDCVNCTTTTCVCVTIPNPPG
jgi:hypothetical protein